MYSVEVYLFMLLKELHTHTHTAWTMVTWKQNCRTDHLLICLVSMVKAKMPWFSSSLRGPWKSSTWHTQETVVDDISRKNPLAAFRKRSLKVISMEVQDLSWKLPTNEFCGLTFAVYPGLSLCTLIHLHWVCWPQGPRLSNSSPQRRCWNGGIAQWIHGFLHGGSRHKTPDMKNPNTMAFHLWPHAARPLRWVLRQSSIFQSPCMFFNLI